MLLTNTLSVVFFATMLATTNSIDSDQTEFNHTIIVNKCCEENEFYALGLDRCRNKTEEMSDSWPPPVYDNRTNKKIDITPSFASIKNLTSCSDSKATSSVDFHLNIDGTIILADGKRLESNDFCLDQILANSTLGEAEFAVRYCVPNPSNQSSYVRKCCPKGMAFEGNSVVCQSLAKGHSSQFNFVFRNNQKQVSYSILYGSSVPKCTGNTFLSYYTPEQIPDDMFEIRTDGLAYTMVNLKPEESISEYCIDDFFNNDFYTRVLWYCSVRHIDHADSEVVLKVFPYFLFLSSIFLIATFVVYTVIPEIRNTHGVTIMCYVASLAVTYILLGTVQTNAQIISSSHCISLAVVGHFSFLSAFTWLNVMSFDIWRAFYYLRPYSLRNDRNQILDRRILFASIYAWGVPFIIVLVGQILDNSQSSHVILPNFGLVSCWFFGRESLWAYLHGPMAVMIFVNVVLFVTTVVLLNRASTDASLIARRNQAKQKFHIIFSLSVITGVSWTMEVISFGVNGSFSYWIFTDILNILTGVFVFIIFVMKPKVWQLLKLRFPFLHHLDRCCPSFMKQSGTNTRSFRSNLSSSTVNPTGVSTKHM